VIETQHVHTTGISRSNITQVAAVEQLCFQSPWSFDACAAELFITGGGGYAATCGDKKSVVGYIFFRVIFDEMHILKIAAAPSWRNRRIASTLLKQTITLAGEKWLRRICLEVRASNIPAINLYNKYGFEQSGIRPGYYGNREDAILMNRNIGKGVLTWQRQ